MIRTHFKQSQFLVVSLKEGMFNNANVLFRTKFVDGVSTVTRTVCAYRPSRPIRRRPLVSRVLCPNAGAGDGDSPGEGGPGQAAGCSEPEGSHSHELGPSIIPFLALHNCTRNPPTISAAAFARRTRWVTVEVCGVSKQLVRKARHNITVLQG